MQMNLRTQPPGSVYVANGVLTVATMRNMTSDVRVEQAGGAVIVSDVNPLDAVGTKCTQVDPKRVSCTGVTAADVAGSYKGDTIRMLAPLPATLSGNTAIDRLYGGTRGDTLDGGDGDDTLIPGTGPDRINGGAGADYADYGARTSSLTLSLDGVANDGAAYEGDNLGLDVESLIGGSANDRLIGSSAANALWGQGGDDTVDGRTGADWLNGGAGTDTADYSLRTKAISLSADGTANDGEAGEGDKLGGDFERLFGGAGSDTILGGSAAERLEGRGGNDTLDGGAGIDVIRGDAGTDTIRSRDALVDDIACGASKDQVFGDLIDQILKKDCEIRSLL
jgi:Ca2+-binding RTX toxin-like protein